MLTHVKSQLRGCATAHRFGFMSLSPDAARSPGQFIRSLLEARGWSQDVLASVLKVEKSAISRLVQDKRTIDAPLSLALSEAFELPAEDFLAVQSRYDLTRAREVSAPDPSRALRAQLLARLPVAEMIKRGWLAVDEPKDVARIESELTRFFGVESPDQIEVLPHAAKKTDVGEDVTPAQLIWLYRVKAIASEMLVPRYSPAAVRKAVEQLDTLLLSPTEVRHVPRILGEAGVRFVAVQSIGDAKIDGVCLWLNDMAPVIGMTLRHDRIDNFWFVLRHEIEHVIRGHGRKRPMLDVELDAARPGTDIAEEERVANEAAAHFCVPKEQIEKFISKKSPYFAERDILGFAATLKLHPGLVVGQLQHRTGRFDRFRNHLAKVRDHVRPSAAVDGWGDVYPMGI
jgi:HTH-type transcriptional regulator/antitoxin HigA